MRDDQMIADCGTNTPVRDVFVSEPIRRAIDPAEARMWARHNRAYDLLTEESCRELIDGLRAQGRQEFPAIVRRTGDPGTPYEVICGARRHFAVSWLRANGAPDFGYLVELRDLTDEEAFRLSDIENRDRQDISDLERARDYLGALDTYYGGSQADMAARLDVSATWLSRHLHLARLPQEVVDAFPSIHDLREVHARQLRPLMRGWLARQNIVDEARAIVAERGGDAAGRPSAAQVMRRFRRAVATPKARAAAGTLYRRAREESGILVRQRGSKVTMAFGTEMSRRGLEAAFAQYLDHRFGA